MQIAIRRRLLLFFLVIAALPVKAQQYDDLVFAQLSEYLTGEANQACVNDGTGVFTCTDIALELSHIASVGVVTADLDLDGDIDVVFANGGPNHACMLGDDGVFACSDVFEDGGGGQDVAAADLDGDGDTDLAFATYNKSDHVCVNNGSGLFACADIPGDGNNNSVGVAAADLNGDGDIDLAFAHTSGEANDVCINDGDGALTCTDVTIGAPLSDGRLSEDVAAADFDGDGDTDLAFANTPYDDFGSISGRNRVCLNDGDAAFICSDASDDEEETEGVTVLDLDADGDVDLAFANYGQVNRVCFNDGNGTFACAEVSSDENYSLDVAAADLDGDGDADLAFANHGPRDDRQPNHFCLNVGAGAFTCANVSGDLASSSGVAVGDFDGMATGLETVPVTARLQLDPAYPNPSDGDIYFRFTTPRRGAVRVALYDAIGHEMRVLHNDVAPAGTTQTLRIDASELPPGVYFARVMVADGSAVQQVVVVE